VLLATVKLNTVYVKLYVRLFNDITERVLRTLIFLVNQTLTCPLPQSESRKGNKSGEEERFEVGFAARDGLTATRNREKETISVDFEEEWKRLAS
jgi:hypothetical protein